MQPEYMLDLLNANNDYHVDVIRSKLTRNIDSTFKEVREELIMAMGDLIPMHEHSTWQSPRQRDIAHTACRVDNCPHSRDCSTRDLPHHESYFCWKSSMSVITSDSYSSAAGADFCFQAGTMTIRL
jgi:hypothetical protein